MPRDRGQHPAGTGLLSAVRAAITRHGLLRAGDRVLVAVSGGRDSVALLHALALLRSEYSLELHVCHVHHGLRAQADHDAEFVERLAARLDCPVTVERVVVRVGSGHSPEEAARAARHAALERTATMIGATRLALGHTADDQAETVLMRVLEGAGPRGLGGMPARRGRLVRPMLGVGRAAVLAHLVTHRLPWVEDETNQDPKFLRNRIRHELLPLVQAQGWPRIGQALTRLARASRETVEALDALLTPRAAGLARPSIGGWVVDLAPFTGLPPGAVKALLRQVVLQAAAPAAMSGLREHHLIALHALLDSSAGARARLPRGLTVERGRDALWITRRTEPPEPVAVAVPGETVLPSAALRLAVTMRPPAPGRPAEPAWEAWFDAGRLPGGLAVRSCRVGDRLPSFGEDVSVRVASLLAGAGIPTALRRRWPLLVAGEDVLWVVGVRRGAAAPIGPGTRAMLQIRASVVPEFLVREESS